VYVPSRGGEDRHGDNSGKIFVCKIVILLDTLVDHPAAMDHQIRPIFGDRMKSVPEMLFAVYFLYAGVLQLLLNLVLFRIFFYRDSRGGKSPGQNAPGERRIFNVLLRIPRPP
jgi:hypothetical protein